MARACDLFSVVVFCCCWRINRGCAAPRVVWSGVLHTGACGSSGWCVAAVGRWCVVVVVVVVVVGQAAWGVVRWGPSLRVYNIYIATRADDPPVERVVAAASSSSLHTHTHRWSACSRAHTRARSPPPHHHHHHHGGGGDGAQCGVGGRGRASCSAPVVGIVQSAHCAIVFCILGRVCVCVCMYLYIYIYTHTHTHTHATTNGGR